MKLPAQIFSLVFAFLFSVLSSKGLLLIVKPSGESFILVLIVAFAICGLLYRGVWKAIDDEF